MNTKLRKKAKSNFEKDFFEIDEYWSLWESYGKSEKT